MSENNWKVIDVDMLGNYSKHLAKKKNKLTEKTRKTRTKNAYNVIEKAKDDRIIGTMMTNMKEGKSVNVSKLSKQLKVSPQKVKEVITSESFKRKLEEKLPADTLISMFVTDLKTRRGNRDKLFEIASKWLGLDKQVMDVNLNGPSQDILLMQKILDGGSILKAEKNEDGVYETALNDEYFVDASFSESENIEEEEEDEEDVG